MSPSCPAVLDPRQLLASGYTTRAIRHKARQLVGRRGFNISEQEDIEQELRLHLLRRFSKFDPRIAHWKVFVRTVIERRAATLVRQRCLQGRLLCLDNAQAASSECNIDLAIDTSSLMAQLPRRSRELCKRLMGASVAEVARQMNIPRSTLRDEITRLREHFYTMRQKNCQIVPPLCPADE
jgi:RNA polymerase sigma factor (sigma-70 family)